MAAETTPMIYRWLAAAVIIMVALALTVTVVWTFPVSGSRAGLTAHPAPAQGQSAPSTS